MVKEINAEEYSEILNSSKPVVIDFHATWCGPCKVLSPILEELDDEIEGVEFVKLDVDQHPQIAGQNQVMGVPTVVILKDGEVKDRFVGVQPKEVIKEKNYFTRLIVLRIVLVLQVLILLLFGFFILNIQNTVNELSGQLETALLTIEDMKTVLPEIEEAVENFNQLEPLFENLGKLSELLSVLTDPFGSNG